MRALTPETTYYKDKLYVPKEIRERMRLMDGDRLLIDVISKDEARIRIMIRMGATKRLIEWLEHPPIKGKVEGTLRRKDFYDRHI